VGWLSADPAAVGSATDMLLYGAPLDSLLRFGAHVSGLVYAALLRNLSVDYRPVGILHAC